MSLPSGTKIGPYEIVNLLGTGGMGEVYRARDTRLDREVALKILAPQGDRARFQSEAKAVAALSHPNIVAIFDVGENYLVTELVDGAQLPVPATPMSRCLDLAVQVADGLAAAHAAGFVHRDLKPGNILVSREGRVKILDFGLAKRVAIGESDVTQALTATQSGMVVGTIAYMSPEQARGAPLDMRSDQFAFGLILYEMVTGQKPFVRDTAPETLTAILRENTPPLPDTVPAPLRWVIERCLAKDAADRYDTTRGLYLELRNLRDHAAEAGDPCAAVLAGRAAGPARRRRWMAPAALLAVAIGAGVWWAARGPLSRANPPESQRLVPLVTDPGPKAFPTFSSDGSRIAYVWKPDQQDSGIFLRTIGQSTPPVRLTHEGISPAWSTDGSRMAFVRRGLTRSQVMLMESGAASERKIAEVATNLYSWGGRWLAWTPDGKWILTPDKPSTAGPYELTAISTETGEKRRVTNPPLGVIGDIAPRISPDGRSLAFLRVSAYSVVDIYTQPLIITAGRISEPKTLTHLGWAMVGLMWSADNKSLLFSADSRGGQRLWWISSTQPGAPQPVMSLASVGSHVTISAKGDRLAYVQSAHDDDIYRQDLPQPGRKLSPSVRLIASSRAEMNARISPDGKKIAFPSNRTGSWEIWVADTSGEHPVQLTSFGGPENGTPRWSPDSRQIAFDTRVRGNADVYLVDASGGTPHPFTQGPGDNLGPSWSHDGKWIYFISNRLGQEQLWKMPVGGGPAVQLTHSGAVCGIESTDGKWVYVTRDYSLPTTLWRVAAEGGEEVKILDPVSQALTYDVTGEGIYYCRRSSKAKSLPGLMFYSFATAQSSEIGDLDRQISIGLGVSPDGRWLAFSGPAGASPPSQDVMLIENFRK